MIGAKYLPPAISESYYSSYRSRFSEAETRREMAQTLIPGHDSHDIVWQYPTRTVLTAQWNDTYKQGLETAKTLYSLEPTLSYYIGQSILKLTGITPQEVKDIRNGKLPKDGFSIDIGTTDKNTFPEYWYAKANKHKLPRDVDPDSTFISYQVTLPINAIRNINISGDGKVEITPPQKAQSDFVAYSGRVSLESDPELYNQTRQTEVGTLAFGNGRSFGIVYELFKATGGSELEAFQDLFCRHEISPSHTLSALGSIAL